MVFRTPSSGVLDKRPARQPRALDRVRLREGAAEFPAGSEGTVVHRYKDGAAFEVEFTVPQAGVVTIEAAKLQVIAMPRKRRSA